MVNLDHNLLNGDNKLNNCSNNKTNTLIKSTNRNVHKNRTHVNNSLLSNTSTDNNLKIFHQNIRGFSNKIDEFLISLSYNSPHVICLTEHHLRIDEINNLYLDQYILGAHFCRKTYKQGGVAIYVHKEILYTNVNLDQYITERDL